MKQVVISVCGGVAEIAYASKGVAIDIVDFDNEEAEGNDGEEVLSGLIEQAKQNEKMEG